MKPKAKKEEEEGEGEVTFIPGNWTHSTAVPVAFERNSAKVSSAMDKSLAKEHKEQSTTSPETHQGKKLKTVENHRVKVTLQMEITPILLTQQGWHPLVDAEESNGVDHLSPPTHN